MGSHFTQPLANKFAKHSMHSRGPLSLSLATPDDDDDLVWFLCVEKSEVRSGKGGREGR